MAVKPWYLTFNRTPKREVNAFVYAILADNGLCKIGISKHPQKRFGDVQDMSPLPVRLLATAHSQCANHLEYHLHNLFRETHSHGEWFQLSETDTEWLKEFLETWQD